MTEADAASVRSLTTHAVDHGGAVRRVVRAAVVTATLAIVLSGCTLQLEPPKLEVLIQPAYPSKNVLIPYELRGDGTYAEARWALRHYQSDFGEWELVRSWEISVPNGSAGILQLDLEDGRYELTGELLTSRGGTAATAATLYNQTEFYVDTIAPTDNITVGANQVGPPYDETVLLEVYPEYDGESNLTEESPVGLYYSLDSTSPPTPDQDPAGASILLWVGGEPFYNTTLMIYAIDQAGNVGNYFVENYSAP